MNISTFLGIPLQWHNVRTISKQLFGDTATFRQGHIGSWKYELTENGKNKRLNQCAALMSFLSDSAMKMMIDGS